MPALDIVGANGEREAILGRQASGDHELAGLSLEGGVLELGENPDGSRIAASLHGNTDRTIGGGLLAHLAESRSQRVDLSLALVVELDAASPVGKIEVHVRGRNRITRRVHDLERHGGDIHKASGTLQGDRAGGGGDELDVGGCGAGRLDRARHALVEDAHGDRIGAVTPLVSVSGGGDPVDGLHGRSEGRLAAGGTS